MATNYLITRLAEQLQETFEGSRLMPDVEDMSLDEDDEILEAVVTFVREGDIIMVGTMSDEGIESVVYSSVASSFDSVEAASAVVRYVLRL